MDGKAEGWMGEWMDNGQKEQKREEWMNGWIDRWMIDGWKYRCKEE